MNLATRIFFVLLVGWIAGMALLGVLAPSTRSPVFQSLIDRVWWAGYSHVIFGSLALILGGFQLSSTLRRRNIKLHRLMGNAYVFCVLVSTIGAITSLPFSESSFAAKSAFWLLAILWPIVTVAGYPWGEHFCIRRHGKLMLYSYALTCAAITLRIILITLLVSGVSFPFAYPIAAWGALIGNIAIAAILTLLFDAKVKSASDIHGLSQPQV